MLFAFYADPGPLTKLAAGHIELVRALGPEPLGVCEAVPGLISQPRWPHDASDERAVRPMAALLDRLLARSGSPLTVPRAPGDRIVGTCRHYAVMAVAFLRANGVPARARCGFAAYFEPGRHVDHWVTEYWSSPEGRWIRVDAETLGAGVLARPHDLAPTEFQTGGEAWQLCRAGDADPMTFGVDAADDTWGPAEIRGNAIRDLAALNKVEMLPWDNWGPMEASYRGATGPEFDRVIDDLAADCESDHLPAIQARYDGLEVPEAMLT